MDVLIEYHIKKSNIDFKSFNLDENYDANNDKIVNINYNEKNFKNTIQLFKSKLLANDLNIKSFVNHIDTDEYYYIKDLFIDLTLPISTEIKHKKIKSFYEYIIKNIIKDDINYDDIIFNTTSDVKKIFETFSKNKKTNKKKLNIFTNYSHKTNKLDYNIEPKVDAIEKFLNHFLSLKHENNVRNQIINLFQCTNDLDIGGSLIFKLIELNSKKIEYTISYLANIYENVYLINTSLSNILKEEFYLICVNKTNESYLNNIPIIPFDYMPENYSNIINIIYFIKIIKKKLIVMYNTVDHYIFINGDVKDNYNKFEYYYQLLTTIDDYNNYLKSFIGN